MNIFEKIKQFLFGKREIKELPEQTQTQSYSEQNKNIIFREDGSQFMLIPMLDRTGNQLYEQVWSEYEKTVKSIPVFNVYSEELRELSPNKNTYMGTRILIDMDPTNLRDSEFVEYLANNVLNKDRMEKIVTSCYNYAGLIEKRVDNEGRVTFRKDLDTSVIDNLNLSEQKRREIINEEMKKREEENIKTMREQAANMEVHYKDSHAEDLSKYNGDER